MSEFTRSTSWQEEFASLVGDTGIRYNSDGIGITSEVLEERSSDFISTGEGLESDVTEEEGFKDQVKGFLKASGEMLIELAKGCKDIVEQSLGNENSFIVRKCRGPWAKVSGKLRFLNEYLPEDRDPVHAWPVVFFVFTIALAALCVDTRQNTSAPPIKKVCIHPPSASRIQLPDGRYISYLEQGVTADIARFSLIAPHSFLSSRLAGIPGVNVSLLEDFGVRLITYDLPGFGESSPHPSRNLNSSAMDMSYIANAVGVNDKFWVLGFSGGGMHSWAALRYIPDKVAGAALFAPMVNPYESSMTKEERRRTWEKWTPRRKFLYFLARKFPRFLGYFYRRGFLSGKHGHLEKRLSLSLGKKDKTLIEDPVFEEFWERDVEESVRQGNSKPFIEEAVLQVSNWGFNIADLRVNKQNQGKGILPWIRSLYSKANLEWNGFLGPIQIWQGMDDEVVPPSMTNFVHRVLPGTTVHQLPGEGHFSYFYFCDECHRRVFSTLFGTPQGPLNRTSDTDQTSLIEEMDNLEEASLNHTTME